MTLKDILNLIAGEVFRSGGPDWFQQQMQVAICMMTANPYLWLTF